MLFHVSLKLMPKIRRVNQANSYSSDSRKEPAIVAIEKRRLQIVTHSGSRGAFSAEGHQ
jgi:hypothetical protein